MRIAVVGAGAVGSYFGGRLAQAGNEVAFLARGKHLEALRARALRVESIKGGFEVRVRATNAAEEIGRVDAILVAVKAWQVTEAAESIRAMIDAESVVVPLQNGVEAPAQLTSVLGPERVTGGLCKIIAYMAGPGHVRHSGAEPFVAFGEFDPAARMQRRLKGDAPVVASHSEARFSREGAEPVGQLSERLQELRHAFVRAGVTCEITPDITGAMWEKFIFIASISGVGAVTRLRIGDLRAGAESRAQLVSAIREMVAVARAYKTALPGEIVERTLGYVDSLPGDGTSSMQRDIMDGLPSELEAQNGAVVRLGRAVGILTPTHEAIYAALLPLENRARGL